VRYRFGDFVLSPGRRVLTGGGRVVPLIPRYFDLLVLLIDQRDRALGKQEIFDRVWSDVVVSESALTQAVRVIRRALGDDPREPTFVRTVSRRGYQFVFTPVELEDDSGPWPPETHAGRAASPAPVAAGAPLTPAEATLARDEAPLPAADADPVVEAELPEPLLDRQTLALASARWASAAVGTAAAGGLGGLVGGVAIRIVSGADTANSLALTLALVGMLAGALAGGGVGIGLAAAEAVARSARGVALAAGGALAGLLTGWLAHHGARLVLTGLFGRDIPAMGGPVEGLVIGAAAGIGYGIATRSLPHGGMAAPRGGARWRVAAITGIVSAIGAAALTLGGRHLVGASLDLMAHTFAGSQVGLEPLARLLGEGHLAPMTRMVVAAFEGLLFGTGLAFGLTTRPRRPADST
jgi:DNA-binding winged helix-turn-helix (wHTH) protein